MSTYSKNQQIEKEFDIMSASTEVHVEKSPRAQQEKKFEETNEDPKTKLLEESDDNDIDWNEIAKLGAAKTTEIRKILAGLTCKLNSLTESFNKKYFGFKEMSDRLNILEAKYQPLRKFLNKLKFAIEKEKSTRRECDKLKEKQEVYKACEKELTDKIYQLEQQIKEKDDKIEAILNEKSVNDSAPIKCALITRNITDDDSSSSLTDYEGIQLRTERQYKYCGMRSKYYMDEQLTYRHLKKTRASITITDSEDTTNPKRKRII